MRRAVSRLIPNKTRVLNNSVIKNLKLDLNSIEDLYISLDEPHRTWLPGEEISGQIVLILKKNLISILVSLSLSGYVKIKSSPSTNIRHKKYYLFNHTIKIYGANDSEGEFGLSKGEHRFPFIVKLPSKNIYTSVDFGRGSIAYLVKASITSLNDYTNNGKSESNSPTQNSTRNLNVNPSSSAHSKSISSPSTTFAESSTKSKDKEPFYSCEKLVTLINPINVSKLPPPKPKTLLIKSPKKLSKTISSTSTLNSIHTVSSVNSDNNSLNNPQNSGNSSLSTIDQQNLLSKIRLSMEITHRGFLRGELIPIKITLQHIKKLQDLNGIIITLVRICRVDNGPDLMVESFRKDLAQNIVPLFVDPINFKSELNTSIRVPADAFPTISGCPLVSFQYFIEVLVNLSGRSFDCQVLNKDFSPNANSINTRDIINTDKLKRLKNVLQLTMEVVVGTERTDEPIVSDATNSSVLNTSLSNLKNGSSNDVLSVGNIEIENSQVDNLQDELEPQFTTTDQQEQFHNQPETNLNNGGSETSQQLSSDLEVSENPTIMTTAQTSSISSNPPIPNYNDSQILHRFHTPTQPLSPLGTSYNLPAEINMSEKEILKKREESLLPSEPKLATVLSESTLELNNNGVLPSAPPITEDRRTSTNEPCAGELNKQRPLSNGNKQKPDKLERERTRLLALQSEPPTSNIKNTSRDSISVSGYLPTPLGMRNESDDEYHDDYSDIDYVPMYEKVTDDELLDRHENDNSPDGDINTIGCNYTLHRGVSTNELNRIATAGS